ncbi:MAG TPA: hypothetical protein VFA59_07005 [Vicinamibacterales bacterium]|nr:hypothetical protein [Vicinamibacterales bacterium]
MAENDIPDGERLDSWKTIAVYLKRDERTVRRWERERGLPVRRVPGGRGRSVFAYTSEIDRWLNTSESAMPSDTAATPIGRPAWHWLAVGTVTIALVVFGAWRLRSSTIRAEDLRISLDENGVAATNARGVEMWRHAFSGPYRVAFNQYGVRLQTPGGRNPAVFAITGARLRRSDDEVESGELFEFSTSGDVRRTFSFDDRVTFDHQEYGPPWVMTSIAVDDRSGARRIAVAAHHYTWSASMVTILDEKFQRHGTYWQWGWIEHVSWITPDRLLIGGFNDAKDGGMVALLDAASLNGQSPASPDTHGYCQTCGDVSPLAMAVMPRSELNRLTNSRFNRATIQLMPDRIVARTVEVPQGTSDAVDILYEFTTDLQLQRASLSGPYRELHDALRTRGQIDHDSDRCPDRNGPREIATWNRSDGWRTLHVRDDDGRPLP